VPQEPCAANIARDPDDFEPGIAAQLEAAANGILIRPEAPRGLSGNHGYRVIAVGLGHQPTLQERDALGAKETGGHRAVVGSSCLLWEKGEVRNGHTLAQIIAGEDNAKTTFDHAHWDSRGDRRRTSGGDSH
jgi:hypothetical protein